MITLRRHGPTLFLLLVLIGALGWSLYEGPEPPWALALLLPSDASAQDPRVSAWRRAAQTEGLPLAVIRDDVFLRPTLRKPIRYAGVIVMDGLHSAPSSILIGRLQSYVETGGKLLVVYTASTLRPRSSILGVRPSRFSRLVGVNYAAYVQLVGPSHMRVTDEKQYAHLGGFGGYRSPILRKYGDGSVIAGLDYSGDYSGKGQIALANAALNELVAYSEPATLPRFLRWFGTDICGLPGLPLRSGRIENAADNTSFQVRDDRKSMKMRTTDPAWRRNESEPE